MSDNYSNACTHDYHHITQSIQDLTDSTQQNTLHPLKGTHHRLQMTLILIATSALQTAF